VRRISGRKPDGLHAQSLTAAGLLAQKAAMPVLLAEMRALGTILPVWRSPPTDLALIQELFDNLRV